MGLHKIFWEGTIWLNVKMTRTRYSQEREYEMFWNTVMTAEPAPCCLCMMQTLRRLSFAFTAAPFLKRPTSKSDNFHGLGVGGVGLCTISLCTVKITHTEEEGLQDRHHRDEERRRHLIEQLHLDA